MEALETLLSEQTIERLGWTLIHFVWQALAVALLLAIVLRCLRRSRSGVRYIVACMTLVLIVALPLVTMQLVEVSRPVAEAGPALQAPAFTDATPVEVIAMDELPAKAFDAPVFEMPKQTMRMPWTQRVAAALEPALPWLVLGWLLGVFGLSTWHLGGWAQLQRMKRRMVRDVAVPLHARLADLSNQLGIRCAVGLLESALVEVPTVVGWIKPVILLPASVLSGLSAEQLEAILAHELAHIRRYDYLVNIGQTVIEILGFYHPAVWWVSHRIRDERENCCDDLAVQVCGDSKRYARALTCLEELRHRGTELAVAASGGSLVARIARLLGRPPVDNRRFAWLPGLIALLVVVAILVPAALVLAGPDALPAADRVESESDAPETADDKLTIEATTQASVDGDEPIPPQILVRFKIFPKAAPDKVLDRETRELVGEILAAEIPQVQDEIASRPNITLAEVLRTWVAGRLLTPDTLEVLVDVLQSRGYLEGEATPELLAIDNKQSQLSVISDELLRLSEDPTSSPEAIELGTFVQVTPHSSPLTSDRITLEIGVEWKDRIGSPDPNSRPNIRLTEVTSTVTVLRNCYFTLLAEPDAKDNAERATPELHLAMFRADLFEPVAERESASASAVPTSDQRLRQIVLDVQTIAAARSDLANRGLEWGWPQISQGAYSSGQWPWGIEIGYTPDKAYTESLLTHLDELCAQGLADRIARQRLTTQDGYEARFKAITEEWFTMLPAQKEGDSEPESEHVSITSGVNITAKPTVGDDGEITLEMTTEVSESTPHESDSDLPMVTRRTARNVVTVKDGGTVVLAGLVQANSDSARDVAILVTAHLAPVDGPLSEAPRLSLSGPAVSSAAAQAPSDWSASVEGVQIRLHADKHLWRTDEIPALHWDVCNVGQRPHLQVDDGQRRTQLEVDGVWYRWPAFLQGARIIRLGPGRSLTDQLVTLSPVWSRAKPEDVRWRGNDWGAIADPAENDTSLQLTRGKHTIRLAIFVEPSRATGSGGFRVVSPPTEITVVSRTPDEAQTWLANARLARAVKATLFSTAIILQEVGHPERPEMSQWIAGALTQARELAPLAANTPLQASNTQMIDGLSRLQQADGQSPAQIIHHLRTFSNARNDLLNVFTGMPAFTTPPAARVATSSSPEAASADANEKEAGREVLLTCMIAEVETDGALDRETATQLRSLLADAPHDGDFTLPSVEQLQKPLQYVLNQYAGIVNKTDGAAKAFADLLISRGYGTLRARPHLLTEVGQRARVIYRDSTNTEASTFPDPTDDYALRLDVTPTVQTDSNSIRLSMGLRVRNLATLDSKGRLSMRAEKATFNPVMSARNDRYIMLPLTALFDPESDDLHAKTVTTLLLIKPTLITPEPSASTPEFNRITLGYAPGRPGTDPLSLAFESVHRTGDRWLVAIPFLDLSVTDTRCHVTADRAELRFDPALHTPANEDVTFLGNVTIEIAGADTDPNHTVLYLDELTFSQKQKRLYSSGPVRLVSGNTELVGQGLELTYGQSSEKPADSLIKIFGHLGALHITPSGSLAGSLGNRKTVVSEGTADGEPRIAPMLSAAIPPDLIDNDPIVRELAKKIAEVEVELLEAQQKFLPQHPEIAQNKQLLEALNRRLEERRRELQEEFHDSLAPRPPSEPSRPGTVTATFQGTDRREALDEIAEKAGVNIMYDANLSGEVHATLDDVSFEVALLAVLGGSPYVARAIPDGYAIIMPDVPPPAAPSQDMDAIGVEARFVLVDRECMEAMQRGLPVAGIGAAVDVNTLHEIGDDLAQGRTPLLEADQVELLLKAVRQYTASRSLAAPKVTVLDGESAGMSLTEQFPYISGYREPNEPSSEPIPQRELRDIGVAFDATPRIIKDQNNIRLQFEMKINSLLGTQKALYESKYEYDIPTFTSVTVATEIVVADGQTALIYVREMPSAGNILRNESAPASPLLMLIKPARTTAKPPEQAPPMQHDFVPGGPGMGGFGGSSIPGPAPQQSPSPVGLKQ